MAGTAKHNLDFTTAFLSKGIATTVAGGNGQGSASNQLDFPREVAFDADGNIYTLDINSIKKWVPGSNEGIIVVPTDSWYTCFFVDPLGNIYVSYRDDHIVKKWAIGATDWITVAGGNGQGVAANQLYSPAGICVDTDGNVYISDMRNNRIQKWAVDATEGITVAGGNGQGAAADQLYNPVDVSVNSDGDVFVLDQNNYRIHKWEPDAVAGSTVASLSGYFPYFFVDGFGNIFVSDRNNNSVLKWNSVTDQWTIVAGGNGSGSDANQLDAPLGITLDGEENLYVADRNNYRIQRVQYAPQITILAGETEGKITIAGIDDNTDGYDETIEITPTTTTNCTLSTPDLISITITDNDEMPSIAFSFSADKIKENSATDVSLIARPSIVSGKDIEIVFTIEGDATEIEEYTLSSKNITILAGESTGQITISTNGLDDDIVEVLKTIIFRVNSIDNATVVSETATLYYESDDDPAVTLVTSKTTIAESESSTITATLETATSKDAIIDFDLTGTAKHNLDYTTAFASRGFATTVAGGNGYGSASNQLSYPIDVSIDADGNMYILDNENIKKWTPGAETGINIVSTNQGYVRFFVDPLGNIYLSVRNNHYVLKWAVGATGWITVAGGHGQGLAANQLNNPAGIYVDADGNIYIADTENHRIQKWADGATEGITVAGGNGRGTAANQLDEPIDVSVDSNGNIYVLDKRNRRIQKWAVDADAGITVTNISRRYESFYLDDSERIFVADQYAHNIQQWMPKTGEWIIVAGGSESGSDANQLNDPWGITLDKNGNLFVADYYNSRIQKFQYGPQIIVEAGETEGKVIITAKEDSSDEYDETIVLTPTIITNCTLSTPDLISITITDNDEIPSIAFSFSADKIAENSATDVSLIARPSIVSGKDIEIVFTIEGNAVETEEYVLSSRNITILAGDAAGRLSISTNGLDDDIVEVLKTITFRVNSIDNATAETETATLYYESDDDPALFTIGASKITIAEHESTILTATLETATSKDAIIDLDLSGTATRDLDFMISFLNKGTATTVAGGNDQGSDANQLDQPKDVSVDADGNIYILENEYIKKWVPGADTGTIAASIGSNFWGNWGYHIFVDPLGNIYFSDKVHHSIKKWEVGATDWVTVAGGNGFGSAANQLNDPMGIAVDADGNIYIADLYNHRIQKWAVDASEGLTVAGGNGSGSADNQLNQPKDVSVDTDGNIYVLDRYNRIQKWVEGELTGSTLVNTSPYSEYFFIDEAKNVYVSEDQYDRIMKWTSSTNKWSVAAGGNSAGSAANQLNYPCGITLDKNGNLYVADRGNHRIQRVQYAPQITVLAGEIEGKLTISGIEDDLNEEGDETIIVKTVSAENAVLGTVEDITITLLDNTKALTLQENPFVGLSNGAVAWGDYDRDGDMDVAVMGLSPLAGSITAVYENQNGTFVDTNQDFARLYDGDISWVDINKDGWIDLVVSGYNETVQTKLYLNNEGTFVATDDYGLPQLFSSKMAWGDLDNDGDIDLAIAGINDAEEYVFYIYYREDGQDNFIKEPNLTTSYWSSTGWPGFIHGDLKIVDVDLDGDNDVVFSGEDSNGNPVGGVRYNTYIRTVAPSGYYYYEGINLSLKNSTIEVARLQNTPYDSLSVISSGIDSYDNIVLKTSNFSGSTDLFPKLKNGDIAFGDFDNDGLNDIVLTGENDAGVPITELFLQNSDGGFRASEIVLQGLRNSTANWVDYDMDGDLDLFLTGLDDTGAKSILYKSETVNKVNTPPTVISGLALEDLGNGNVRLSWDVPTDDFSTNLGYVVRLGTTPGGTELSNTESDLETGVRLISKPAPVYTNFIETQLDPGVYYWSVQAVDQGLKGGAFSEESSFMLTYEWKLLNQGGIVDKSINAYEDPVIRLADIDNDDDMDLIYGSTTSTYGQVQVFKYDGKRLINESNLFNVGIISDVEVGDVNGDGIADVLFNSIYSGSYYLHLYISNGSNFVQTNIDNGLYKAKGRIVDLNNDGQAEVVLIGLSSSLSTGNVKFYIYEYDATSNPVFNKIDVSDQIASLSAASFDLGDIDNDQDIDLVMSGFSAAVGLKSYVYENVTEMSGSYQFVAIENDLVATIEGTNNLIDFDGDGDLDVVITGTSIAGDVFEIYENQIIDGSSTWSKLDNTGLIPMRLGKVDLGDFNGDGYSDLLYSGLVGGTGKVTNLSEFNPTDNSFLDSAFDVSDIIDADVEFGDLEGDGDLDFAISGERRDAPGTYVFRAYVNVRNESAIVLEEVAGKSSEFGNGFKAQMDKFTKNDPPATPIANIPRVISGLPITAEGYPIEFSWMPSSDDNTPFGGLTYSLKVGKTPGGEEIMSSNSNSNGVRKSATKGNAEHNTSWRLRLKEGTYYWSVQAVDASYSGSEFSPSAMFEVSAALGVEDIAFSEKLFCYPNPTRGLLRIQVSGNDAKANLIVRNLIGAIVYQENIEIASDRKAELDISKLPNAMYMLSIETASFNQVVKITKE